MIPGDTVRGTVRFQDIVTHFDALVPELADCGDHRPSQATSEVGRVFFCETNSVSWNGEAER